VFNVEIVEGKMRLFGEVHAAGKKEVNSAENKDNNH